jgi:hypothetical protein
LENIFKENETNNDIQGTKGPYINLFVKFGEKIFPWGLLTTKSRRGTHRYLDGMELHENPKT